jgi:DNA-binding SARP family transcriptional activator
MSDPSTRILGLPEPATARFELRCWGEFSLVDRLRGVDCAPRGRKARAIIAFLSAQNSAAVSRERLCGLLWSERGDQQARASLRQTLFELKHLAMGAARLVEVERELLRLNAFSLTSDLVRLEVHALDDDLQAFAAALEQRGERLYGGLDGLDPAFDEWLALERQSQQDRLLSIGLAAAERGLRHGACAAASRVAAGLQALDPANETVAQVGMRADHACGDLGAVRRRHRRLCEVLRQDLGVAPSPETEALLRSLDGRDPPAVAPVPTPGPAKPEIGANNHSVDVQAAPSPSIVADEVDETGVSAPRRSWRKRRWRWTGFRLRPAAVMAIVVAVLAAAGAAWLFRDQFPGALGSSPRVQVAAFTPLETDPQTRDFSVRLTDQVTGVLKDNVVGISLVDGPGAGSRGADLKVKGTVSRDGDDWRVRASLEDAQGVTLWSREFKRPPSEESMLQLETAVAATEVVGGAIGALHEKAARRDPRALALYLQSGEAITNPGLMNRGEPRRLLEEAVTRAPDFVAARATLALALVSESVMSAPSDRKLLAQRARQEAVTAIRSNAARAAVAYGALYAMARTRAPDDLAAAENVLIDGTAKSPRSGILDMFRCRFLAEVGLAREGLHYCQRALAQNPISSPLGYRYAEALYAGGSPELAARAIENTVRYHPEGFEPRRVQFEIAAFSGDPDAATVLLHRSSDAAPCACMPSTPEGIQALDLFLAARKSGSPRDADKALAALKAAVQHFKLHPRYFVFAATALGRPDDAFDMLDRIAKFPGPIPMLQGDPAYLFEGPAAPLQRDRRFWPLAAQTGYAKYWAVRGVLPDFCSDPTLPYDCRVEAARVASIAPMKALS